MKAITIYHLMNDYLDNHTLVKSWRELGLIEGEAA